MTEPGRKIHESPNGDSWRLLCDPETGQSFVRHIGNPASGGHTSDSSLAAFLAADRGGPEHQALWQLIGSLAETAVIPPSAVA